MDNIKYEDFAKLELVVVTITDANLIDGADKLIRLTVDDGTPEPRTIVAGIKKQFPLCPESKAALVGSQVVIVANLEPRTLKGVVSRGMVLAASTNPAIVPGDLQLVSTQHYIAPGSKVG